MQTENRILLSMNSQLLSLICILYSQYIINGAKDCAPAPEHAWPYTKLSKAANEYSGNSKR